MLSLGEIPEQEAFRHRRRRSASGIARSCAANAAREGITEVLIGSMHRGRLNLMANILDNAAGRAG